MSPLGASRWIALAIIAQAPMLSVAHAEPALAVEARAALVDAAFVIRDKPGALGRLDRARLQAEAMLADQPANLDAKLQRAIAIGYRGKLNRSPGDAKTARRMMEEVAAAAPASADANVALAGWHLEAILDAGSFIARTVLGARKADGVAAIERAVTNGGGRPLYSGYGAILLTRIGDTARAVELARMAVRTPARDALDRLMKVNAEALLAAYGSGDPKLPLAVATRLSPFGRIATR